MVLSGDLAPRILLAGLVLLVRFICLPCLVVANDDSPITGTGNPPDLGSPCRADLDCNPTTFEDEQWHWRCLEAPGEVPKPENNCHIPGPYTIGNSTCRCSSEICQPTIPPPTPHSSKVNRTVIQYLMIGDSISLGMEGPLRKILEQQQVAEDGHWWNLTHNSGNAASANLGVHCVEEWIRPGGGYYWDVISFNFGLHGLAHDTEFLTDDQYRILLSRIVSGLVALQKDTDVKLYWVTTTPVPTVPVYDGSSCNDTSTCLNPPRYDHDVIRRNRIAHEVIATENKKGQEASRRTSPGAATSSAIEKIDLYSYVLSQCGGKQGYSNCDGFQTPYNVHYTPRGWDLMASFLAGALLRQEGSSNRSNTAAKDHKNSKSPLQLRTEEAL